MSFSREGLLLLSGSLEGTVSLWELSSGRELRRLEGHSGAVWSVSFSPNSRHLVSGSSDGTIRIWKVATGACLAILAPLPAG